MNKINLYAFLPKVDEILEEEKIKELLDTIPRKLVVNSIRQEIESLRSRIKEDGLNKEDLLKDLENLVDRINLRAHDHNSYKLKKVINATGVIIHTNLGRSPLNHKIMDHIRDISTNYSNLEYDIKTGQRGSRYSIVESLICEITGAESALIVNNNAAGLLLALSTLSKDKEVIVSRGELIEIGGSFRIPDLMEQSGARLREIGTTNRTHLSDYEKAISEDTGALLKVHTSNYKILGFTSAVATKDLVDLKTRFNLPLIEDIGSGVLIDISKYGLDYEPTVKDSLLSGADIVTFSGDKLLGGPQAGIIVGKEEYISPMKRNPLTRALRVDKFTIAALEASLKYYLDEDTAIKEIPSLNMLTMSIDEIEEKANQLLDLINHNKIDHDLNISIKDSQSQVGGGSLPLEKLPTKCLVLNSNKHKIEEIEKILRNFETPIITRIYQDEIYLDLRTIKREDFQTLVQGLSHVVDSMKES